MLVSKPFRQFQKVDQLNLRKIFTIFSSFSSLHKSFVPYLSWLNFLKLFFNGLKSHTIPVVIYMHYMSANGSGAKFLLSLFLRS
jgi:hypothetical protein